MLFRFASVLGAACALVGVAELAVEESQPKTQSTPALSEPVHRLDSVPRSLRREVEKEERHIRATRPKKPSTIVPGAHKEALPAQYGVRPRSRTSSGLPEIDMKDFANLAMQSGPMKPVHRHTVQPKKIEMSKATSMYKRATPAKDSTKASSKAKSAASAKKGSTQASSKAKSATPPRKGSTQASSKAKSATPPKKGSTQARRPLAPKTVDMEKLTNMYRIKMPAVSQPTKAQPRAQPKAQSQVQSKKKQSTKEGGAKHSPSHHQQLRHAPQDHSQVDSDHDSVPDAIDFDDDNDGISDNHDRDNVNYGISDAAMKAQIKAAVDLRAKKRVEAAREISTPRHSAKTNLQEYKDDFDLDGIKNSKDLDDDNDGITDDFDEDSNNDGIKDKAKPTLMDWRN